jgi:hypothetical protein
MKKTKILFMLLPCLVIACSGGGSSEPGKVAEKFNKAIYTGDFEEAKTLCTEDSKQAIDFVAAFASQSIDKMKKADVSYEVTKAIVAEDGNSADVDGFVLGSINLQTNEVADSVESKTHLVKVNEQWLVDFKLK